MHLVVFIIDVTQFENRILSYPANTFDVKLVLPALMKGLVFYFVLDKDLRIRNPFLLTHVSHQQCTQQFWARHLVHTESTLPVPCPLPYSPSDFSCLLFEGPTLRTCIRISATTNNVRSERINFLRNNTFLFLILFELKHYNHQHNGEEIIFRYLGT